jgi:hypothetical protein
VLGVYNSDCVDYNERCTYAVLIIHYVGCTAAESRTTEIMVHNALINMQIFWDSVVPATSGYIFIIQSIDFRPKISVIKGAVSRHQIVQRVGGYTVPNSVAN